MVVGIVAHVDAGKTTLSESFLYLSGKTRKMGRVDNRDAFLDHFELERARGITIFSKQAMLELGDTHITLLDTLAMWIFNGDGEDSPGSGLCYFSHQWRRWSTEPYKNSVAAPVYISYTGLFVHKQDGPGG